MLALSTTTCPMCSLLKNDVNRAIYLIICSVMSATTLYNVIWDKENHCLQTFGSVFLNARTHTVAPTRFLWPYVCNVHAEPCVFIVFMHTHMKCSLELYMKYCNKKKKWSVRVWKVCFYAIFRREIRVKAADDRLPDSFFTTLCEMDEDSGNRFETAQSISNWVLILREKLNV